jgi:adenylate cyclase
MRARTLYRLRILAGVTALSALAGAVYGVRFAPTGWNLAAGVMVGAMNGLAITLVEIALQGPGAPTLRRLPLVVVLALRTLVYGAVFLLTGAVAQSLVAAAAPGTLAGGMLMRPSLRFSLTVALGFNVLFMLNALLGPRVLLALATGRYRRPRSEQRVVLYLDLHDSTHHAERLGDEDFHRFLNRVFFDITDPVLDAVGEIYRYIGDEIIITWPLPRGARNAAAATCFFAIEDALAKTSGEYRRAFGTEPRLRGAMHAGTLVVGEMGDLKREM